MFKVLGLILSASFIIFLMYKQWWGIFFLTSLYLTPIFLFMFKASLVNHSKKAKAVYSYLRKKNIFIILIYISFTMTIFSLVGSLYPLYAKENYLLGIADTFNKSGFAAIFLALPIFIITKILDRGIIELSGFVYTDNGLFDPITGQENISLRYESFVKLIENVDLGTIKPLGMEIGKDYGEIIKQKCGCLNLKEYIDYWLETDKKAGLIGDISIEGSSSSPNLKISSSFAKRIKISSSETINSEKMCKFFEAYVGGILASFDDKIYELEQNQCHDCTKHDICYFHTTKIE